MKLNFKLSDINPASNQDASESVPENWYKCVIIREEMKRNSKNTGSFLQFTLKIVEGDYRGTEVQDTLNIDNPNPVAVKLAGQRLAAYSWVTLGHANESETMEFQDTPFMARIGPQKDQPKYSRVYELRDLQGGEPGTQKANPTQPTQTFMPNGGTTGTGNAVPNFQSPSQASFQPSSSAGPSVAPTSIDSTPPWMRKK